MRPVQEAIHARRSIRTFATRPVDRAVLQRLLDAATQAPNHRLTRPWRFFVLDRPGPKRDELTRIAEDIALRAMPEPHDNRARERAQSRASEVASPGADPGVQRAGARRARDARELRGRGVRPPERAACGRRGGAGQWLEHRRYRARHGGARSRRGQRTTGSLWERCTLAIQARRGPPPASGQAPPR